MVINMLSEHLLRDKNFENLMQEARIQIPLYSKEWTNFNPSEPAVTILENISEYTILQQANMGKISDSVKEKIFSLFGYKRKEGKNARVMLQPLNVNEPVTIPSGQRFMVGDLSYETTRKFKINGNKILGIYGKHDSQIKDFSTLTDKDIPIEISIFSDEPEKDMEIYIVMDSNDEFSEELIFYINMAEYGFRNKFGGTNMFANIRWQCYVENGFADIRCRDYTGCFLNSGEIKFKLPKDRLAIYDKLPKKGYVIRGILTKAEYDIPPRVKNISGFLFEVWQKETKSICYTFSGRESINIYCDLLEAGYIQIFCKEEDRFYYRYERSAEGHSSGRYYNVVKNGFGNYTFSFNREKYGYSPGNFDNAVKIVVYSEEIMRQFDLGRIYGYDKQKIELPVKNIVKESFSLIVSWKVSDKEKVYEFIKPDSSKEGDFKYTLLESEGIIIIEDAADYINGRIFMCGCATTSGDEGNVREGTFFEPFGFETDIKFVNPAAGFGGRKKETIEHMKQRFISEMQNHYTAVEAKDYERIVMTTPELCIHKVRAIPDKKNNKVSIAVKPYSTKQFPQLSSIYINAILKRLEERRLITTGIEIMQPVYAAVDVQGTIYVKPHFEGCKEQIEEVIRKHLDYINSDINFGERMNFDKLFNKVELLECVDFIYDLSAEARNRQYAKQSGVDIIPYKNCLLYPGKINIELNTV